METTEDNPKNVLNEQNSRSSTQLYSSALFGLFGSQTGLNELINTDASSENDNNRFLSKRRNSNNNNINNNNKYRTHLLSFIKSKKLQEEDLKKKKENWNSSYNYNDQIYTSISKKRLFFQLLVRTIVLGIFGAIYGLIVIHFHKATKPKFIHENLSINNSESSYDSVFGSNLLGGELFGLTASTLDSNFSIILGSTLWALFAIIIGIGLPIIDELYPNGTKTVSWDSKKFIFYTESQTNLSSEEEKNTKFKYSSLKSQNNNGDDDNDDEETIDDSTDETSKLLDEGVFVISRTVCAVIGIVFGVRRLKWSSNIQQSLVLCIIINPSIWWSFDSTPNGLLLAILSSILGVSSFALSYSNQLLAIPSSTDYFAVLIWVSSVLFFSTICLGRIGRYLFA